MVAVSCHLEFEYVGNVAIATLLDEKVNDRDNALVDVIGGELFALAGQGWDILLDMRHVKVFEELSIGKLIALKTRKMPRGQKLAIYRLHPDIFADFCQMKLLAMLGVLETTSQETALEFFAR